MQWRGNIKETLRRCDHWWRCAAIFWRVGACFVCYLMFYQHKHDDTHAYWKAWRIYISISVLALTSVAEKEINNAIFRSSKWLHINTSCQQKTRWGSSSVPAVPISPMEHFSIFPLSVLLFLTLSVFVCSCFQLKKSSKNQLYITCSALNSRQIV